MVVSDKGTDPCVTWSPALSTGRASHRPVSCSAVEFAVSAFDANPRKGPASMSPSKKQLPLLQRNDYSW